MEVVTNTVEHIYNKVEKYTILTSLSGFNTALATLDVSVQHINRPL